MKKLGGKRNPHCSKYNRHWIQGTRVWSNREIEMRGQRKKGKSEKEKKKNLSQSGAN